MAVDSTLVLGLVYTVFATSVRADNMRITSISSQSGENATLPCEIDGEYDARNVSWSFDDNQRTLTNGYSRRTPRYRIIQESVSRMDLQIKNINKFDGGLYLCSYNGEVVTKVRLNIRELSSVSDMDRHPGLAYIREVHITKIANERARLMCPFGNLDPNKVNWYFKKSEKDPGNPKSIGALTINQDDQVEIDNENVFLIFQEVNSGNNGLYECKNNDGLLLAKTRLTVQEPVTIDGHSESMTVHRGASISLWCNATGNPEPVVTWWKLSDGADDSHEELFVNGNRLGLNNISAHCAGTYQCRATNTIGDRPKEVERQIFVNILYKPIIHIQKEEGDARYNRKLVCMVLANPNATGIWQDESLNEISNPHYLYSLNTLEFNSGTSDEAVIETELNIREPPTKITKFSCNATNEYGSTVKYVSINP